MFLAWPAFYKLEKNTCVLKTQYASGYCGKFLQHWILFQTLLPLVTDNENAKFRQKYPHY
jgi:hypothetical protein